MTLQEETIERLAEDLKESLSGELEILEPFKKGLMRGYPGSIRKALDDACTRAASEFLIDDMHSNGELDGIKVYDPDAIKLAVLEYYGEAIGLALSKETKRQSTSGEHTHGI